MATKPRYRLMIEGAPTEWVTDISLQRTQTDGRVRRIGLLYQGLEIDDTIDLRESDIKSSGMTMMIRSSYADAEFAYHPEPLGYLAADIDYNDATIELRTNTALISSGDVVHMGTEALKVTAVAFPYLSVTRQYWDTQAQGHYEQVEDKTEYVPIYNRVPSYEGRRVYLFEYDGKDTGDRANLFDFATDYQGSEVDTADKVVWRGVISRPPRLDSDGLTWLLDVEPITFLFEQEIAKTEAEIHVTGINHHAMSGFFIDCIDYDTGPTASTTYTIRGFYPTEEAFIEAVNARLAILRTTAFTYDPQSITFDWSDESGYKLVLKTNSTYNSELDVMIVSPLIGTMGMEGVLGAWRNAANETLVNVEAGSFLSANTTYYKLVDEMQTLKTFGVYKVGGPDIYSIFRRANVFKFMNAPRTIIGVPASRVLYSLFRQGMEDTSQLGSYWNFHLFLDHDPGPMLDVGSKLFITSEYEGENLSCYYTVDYKGTHVTYGTTYIRVSTKDPSFNDCFPISSDSTITVVTDYGDATNIGGMIDGVVDLAVEANKGITPFVTFADINGLSATVMALTLSTDWTFLFSHPITLMDIIREHCKLYGWFLYINSIGQVAFSPIESISQTDGTTALTIDDTYIVTPTENGGFFPRWEPAIDGVVSVVEISRGYDWTEDKFTDSDLLTVRDVASLSTHKNRSRSVTKMEPRGTWEREGNGISAGEGARRAREYLALHSTDYDVITMAVTRKVFGYVTCGSLVKVTSPHVLDSSSGTRGITNRVGIVIARRYSLDPDNGAVGQITVRINREVAAGYAPAMWSTAYTVYSGSVYTATVASTYFAPSGSYDTSFFTVGDSVRVCEHKSAASPNQKQGTITAINSTTSVNIDIDSPPYPTSASGYWEIEFMPDGGSLNDGQTDYCYVADMTGLAYDGTIGRRFK